MTLKFLKLGCLMAILLVMILAVMTVHKAYLRRIALNELYVMRDNATKIKSEWNELILEQSTFVALERVEKLAQLQLNMHIPDQTEVRYINYD